MQLEHRDFNIVRIMRRWLWLLILTPVLASLVVYGITEQQPPIYGASTRLVVGPGIDSASPDLNSLRTGGQLMQTYAKLATTRPVLARLIEDLGLNLTPQELLERIQITSNEETQILTITVEDTDRARAIAIANQIAETVVRMSPSGPESPAVRLNTLMQNTVDKLGAEIVRIERSIESLEI
jgi:capsular polysaccharide biosynthesis protein